MFLSHASEDKNLVRRLAEALRAGGIDTFFDEWDIRIGDSIRRRIDEGLKNSTHFLIVLSPRSVGKPWVDEELDAAFDRLTSDGMPILPVLLDAERLDRSSLPSLLRGKLAFSLSPSLDNVQRLIDDIHRIPRGPRIDHTAAGAQPQPRPAITPSPNRSRAPQFADLDERSFEEMCRALLHAEPHLHSVNLYGTRGQKQFGIDIIGHRRDGTGIEVVSCKCMAEVRDRHVRLFSDDFLDYWDSHWRAKKVRRFVLAVAAPTDARQVQDAIESEIARFHPLHVVYESWGPSQLQERLRPNEGIVRQYLGEHFIPILCASPNSPPIPSPVGEMHGVPRLPSYYLPRPEALKAIKSALLGSAGPVAISGKHKVDAIQGMAGVGKTVLAIALARDEEIGNAFPDGIFWATLGHEAILADRLTALIEAAGGKTEKVTDVQLGTQRLQEVLKGRRCLLILDDVWDVGQVMGLEAVEPPARLLITTRDADIVRSLRATDFGTDVLAPAAALDLLAEVSGTPRDGLPAAAEKVARACGFLPLALTLVGRMIDGRPEMWEPILETLGQRRHEDLAAVLPDYLKHRHVFAAIEASVAGLEEDRDRYLDLAIFPEDLPVPHAPLRALWGRDGLSKLRIQRVVDGFVARSLAVRDKDGNLLLHDLQGDFVRAQADADLPSRHARMVEAYRALCCGEWHKGPDDDYFFQHLPRHLLGAGLAEDHRALLFDYRWLRAKIQMAGVADVVTDFEALEEDAEARRLEATIELAGHILARDPRQLAGQLLGRLSPNDGPSIVHLLAEARRLTDRPVLLPTRPTLASTGSALIRVFRGHEAQINALVALPDGRLTSGSSDKTVRLWDIESYGSTVLKGHTDSVTALAILSANCLASGSKDGTIRLWDLAADITAVMRDMAVPMEAIEDLAVLSDGRLVSASSDGRIRLWDRNGAVSLRCPAAHIASMARLFDGRLIWWSRDGKLRFWDPATNVNTVLDGHSGPFYPLVQLPSGRLASGDAEGAIRLWDFTTGEQRSIHGHTRHVEALVVFSDGRLASGSKDGTVLLWDFEMDSKTRFEGHTGYVTSIVYWNRWIASGSFDGTVRLWNTMAGQCLMDEDHQVGVTAIVAVSDGRLAFGGIDSVVTLCDTVSGTTTELDGHTDSIFALVALPDGRLASGSFDGTVRLWDTSNPRDKAPDSTTIPAGYTDSILALAVLADGRIAAGCMDGSVRVWNETTGTVVVLPSHSDRVSALVGLPDGRLASAGKDGSVRLWDIAAGTYVALEGHIGAVSTLAVLPDGRLASGGRDKAVRIWDLNDNTSVSLTGHTGWVLAVAVLDNGYLISSGADRTVRLWNIPCTTHEILFEADASLQAIGAFHGNKIAVGDRSGRIHLLEVAG